MLSLLRLLDRLSLIPRTVRLSADRQDRRTTLCLEVLENRLCPATDIWTGAGAVATLAQPNANWSNPQNWAAHAAPKAGDSLSFPASSSAKVSVNDYASGTTFASIVISGNNYQITGNAVQLQGGLINSAGFNTVALPITLTAAQTFNDYYGASLILSGAINNGGCLLTVEANGTVLFNGSSISGSGGLTMTGNTKFFLGDTSPNTYTGVTTVTSGTMYLDAPNGNAIIGKLVIGDGIGSNESDVVRLALGNQIASTSAVAIAWTGLLDLNGFDNTIGPLTMSGGNITTGTGTLTLSANVTTLAASTSAIIDGNLTLGTGTTPETFTVGRGSAINDLNIKATISGGAGVELIKAGLGTMQLIESNSYAGPTLVSAGTLVAANPNALGASSLGTTVSTGATLVYQDPDADSTCTFASEPLTLNGGTLLVNGNSPTLIAPGQITLAADSTIEVNSGNTLSLPGLVTGPGGFTKAWAGEVDLGYANTYAGTTVVNNGILFLGNTQALGSMEPRSAGQVPWRWRMA